MTIDDGITTFVIDMAKTQTALSQVTNLPTSTSLEQAVEKAMTSCDTLTGINSTWCNK